MIETVNCELILNRIPKYTPKKLYTIKQMFIRKVLGLSSIASIIALLLLLLIII